MVIFIHGATHTGKTLAAQKILEKYKYPYISSDHIKMGLIRRGYTSLVPEDDGKLTDYLWPVLREMAKTAVENKQNLVIEGCYIPPDWKNDFSEDYLENIRYKAIILSEDYITENFEKIKAHACDIECRQDDSGLSKEQLIKENADILGRCKKYDNPYILIDACSDYNPYIIRDMLFY